MQQLFGILTLTLMFMALLFLPALIELGNPKDKGPRKIVGFKTRPHLHLKKDLEQIEQTLNRKMPFVAFDFLTNLEV